MRAVHFASQHVKPSYECRLKTSEKTSAMVSSPEGASTNVCGNVEKGIEHWHAWNELSITSDLKTV